MDDIPSLFKTLEQVSRTKTYSISYGDIEEVKNWVRPLRVEEVLVYSRADSAFLGSEVTWLGFYDKAELRAFLVSRISFLNKRNELFRENKVDGYLLPDGTGYSGDLLKAVGQLDRFKSDLIVPYSESKNRE